MNLIKLNLILLSTVIMMGCAQGHFYKTGEHSYSKRALGCDFTIYTTRPNRQFNEVGFIELGNTSTLEAVKKTASPMVCANGGNGLLVWEANGHGNYLKATVIHVEK